jgi:antitoxin component of MazEF toxin-antitoxin module
MRDNDTVEITAEKDSLILRKVERKTHKTIQERFKDFDGEYDLADIDWGGPAGNELW